MSDDTSPTPTAWSDRVAVVTGGASGIGRAMCERFAAEGAKVAVVDLDEEAGGAVAAAVGGMFVRADVTSSDEVEALYDEVAGRYGGIDICCNNAGISPPDDDSILETGLDAWDRVQRVNLTSVYLCCKHALPAPAGPGQGLDHQHRLVRGRHGRGHEPDQLHGVARAACWPCRASSACSSPARACGSTRCARAR